MEDVHFGAEDNMDEDEVGEDEDVEMDFAEDTGSEDTSRTEDEDDEDEIGEVDPDTGESEGVWQDDDDDEEDLVENDAEPEGDNGDEDEDDDDDDDDDDEQAREAVIWTEVFLSHHTFRLMLTFVYSQGDATQEQEEGEDEEVLGGQIFLFVFEFILTSFQLQLLLFVTSKTMTQNGCRMKISKLDHVSSIYVILLLLSLVMPVN
jgi:hypothetical protein